MHHCVGVGQLKQHLANYNNPKQNALVKYTSLPIKMFHSLCQILCRKNCLAGNNFWAEEKDVGNCLKCNLNNYIYRI